MTNTPVRRVLELLAQEAGITYRVRNPLTLEVQFAAQPGGVVIRRTPKTAPEPTPEAGGVGPFRVGGDVHEPERVHYVGPEYPELARRARLEGGIVMEAVIDTAGNVKDTRVLRGLGLGLDEAASKAVGQWKYTPTRYNGRPVEVLITVTVIFELVG